MTTYTLEGFAVYYSNVLEGEAGAKFSDITLEIVVPESTTSFDYSLLPLGPGAELPDDQYVDTNIDDYTVRLNGNTIVNSFQIGEGFFVARWTDQGGIARDTIIYVVERLDVNVPGFGIVDPQNIFVVGGDALPSFSTFAEWTDFQNTQIDSFALPTGAFGPHTTIQLADIGATVAENDIITGTGQNDKFFSGLGADDISGRGGNDVLNGGKGNDTLKGNGGDDKLLGKSGKDTMGGDVGNDKLFGGNGNDKLFGDGGKDVLNGGRGNDIFVGGGGSDKFVFQNNSGNDRIKDFDATNNLEDINLKAVTSITGFNDMKNNHMTEVGNDVIIDDHAGTVITLLNVDLADLGKADFIF